MAWFDGKTLIISGASSGIGRRLTVNLIKKHKCRVIGIGRDEGRLKLIKSELKYLASRFSYRLFDVSIKENWTNLYNELSKNSIQVDIIINNAGMLPPFDLTENITEEEFTRCMDVNFNSCRYAIDTFLPMLRNSKTPGILNISSIDAVVPIIGTSPYASAKSALLAYTEVLIAEEGRYMYVGYACPGFVKTNIFRNQEHKSYSGIVGLVASDADKTALKIIKKMSRGKSRIITGKDGKIMNFFYKLMPVLSIKFFEIILKKSKNEMFENIK